MNYEELLKQLALKDERIIVLTAENRAAIRNIHEALGSRFIDTGITEQTMIGMAAGLALRGRIPVVHALATFLTMRAFEFIRTDIGVGHLPVKLMGSVPGFLSEANGPTHQALEDITIMRGIPGMNIFCPADEEDMLLGLEEVLFSQSPFYIRFNNQKPAIQHKAEFTIGKAETVSEGSDVTILTYGFLLSQALGAKEILEANGVSVRLINLRTLKPIDENAILKAIKETLLVVTLEDHFLTGGLFSIVAELLLKYHMQGNVFPISLDDRWFKPAMLDDLLEYEGFTASKLADKILQKFRFQDNETFINFDK